MQLCHPFLAPTGCKSLQCQGTALRSKIEADSVVTAAVLLSMFPEKHAGCDLPFSAGWLDGAGHVCSNALTACTGLQKQGRKFQKPCCHVSEAVKKQQLVLGQCGWQQK